MVAFGRDGSERYTSALNFTLKDRPSAAPALSGPMLVSVFDGQCLDVAGGSRDEGARVLAWPCHGAGNQRLRLESLGGEQVRLIAQHSGSCLALPVGAGVGDRVVQRRCTGGAAVRARALRGRLPAEKSCFWALPGRVRACGQGLWGHRGLELSRRSQSTLARAALRRGGVQNPGGAGSVPNRPVPARGNAPRRQQLLEKDKTAIPCHIFLERLFGFGSDAIFSH